MGLHIVNLAGILVASGQPGKDTNAGDALSRIIIGLGPSLRKLALRPYLFTNTHILRGHTSPPRL